MMDGWMDGVLGLCMYVCVCMYGLLASARLYAALAGKERQLSQAPRASGHHAEKDGLSRDQR